MQRPHSLQPCNRWYDAFWDSPPLSLPEWMTKHVLCGTARGPASRFVVLTFSPWGTLPWLLQRHGLGACTVASLEDFTSELNLKQCLDGFVAHASQPGADRGARVLLLQCSARSANVRTVKYHINNGLAKAGGLGLAVVLLLHTTRDQLVEPLEQHFNFLSGVHLECVMPCADVCHVADASMSAEGSRVHGCCVSEPPPFASCGFRLRPFPLPRQRHAPFTPPLSTPGGSKRWLRGQTEEGGSKEERKPPLGGAGPAARACQGVHWTSRPKDPGNT